MVIIGLIFISGCTSDETGIRDYRQDMRDFVQRISRTAKTRLPAFLIIPQNGHELLTDNGDANGTEMEVYLKALDGIGREDLFYGYDVDNIPTPVLETDNMISFMDIAENNGIEVLVTDYCWTQSYVEDSYSKNAGRGYISFAASHRELDNIPDYPLFPYNVNSNHINTLATARNFLYLLNPESFPSKENFLSAIRNTNYDLIIIDLFFRDNSVFNVTDIESLKVKSNGGHRLVIAYMSIGEAEDYRYYWQEEWENNQPDWIEKENDQWPGNYIVRYWDEDWQRIIYKDNDSYLIRIMNAGFDGVYLDIIDAFEYFEN